MCRVIDQVGDYKILKASRSYVVKNVKGGYDNHGHFKKLDTCYLIIKLLQKRQVPKSRYLRESVIRIVTDIDYTNFVRKNRCPICGTKRLISVDKAAKQKEMTST